MIPPSLGEIAAVVGGRIEGQRAVTVSAPAVLDGRRAEPGGLFVAFAGEYADGHDYAVRAGREGAPAVLGTRPTALPTVVVKDAGAALQALAAHVVIGDIAELTGLAAPNIAVVLNVGQAHPSHLTSRAAIARAKGELVQGLAPGGTAVLGADDPRVTAMCSLTDRAVLTFGRAEHADVRVRKVALDQLARPSLTLHTAAASPGHRGCPERRPTPSNR